MAIPDFDKHGNLPVGRHAADVAQVRERLVAAFPGSRTRSGIFEYWRHHRLAVTDLVEVSSVWLAGSFASDKPNPNDVDVVMLLDGPAFDELPAHRQLTVRVLMSGHYTEDFWSCDAYPIMAYPPDHPGHNMFLVALERWEDYFGHDRDGRPCGFVEVSG